MTYNQKDAEAFIKPKPKWPSDPAQYMTTEEQRRYLLAHGALTGPATVEALTNAPTPPRGVSVPPPIPLGPRQSMAHRLPVHPEVVQIVDDLGPRRLGFDLAFRLVDVCMLPMPDLTKEDKQTALAGLLRFLELADEGIPLTAADYMKPSVVRELVRVLPSTAMWSQFRQAKSESLAGRLPWLRILLRNLGLLRKYKGFIRTTKQGAALVDDPEGLWNFFKGALPDGKDGTGNRTIQWLYLVNQALGDDDREGRQTRDQTMAVTMNTLGWRAGKGDDQFNEWVVSDYLHSVRLILDNVGTGSDLLGNSRNVMAERLAAEIIRLDID